MANPEHLKIIQKGVRTWNEWRRKSPKTKPNLSGARLCFMDFSGANFCDVNFENAELMGAIFSRTQLKKANLRNAILSDAKFDGAILEYSDFTNARIGGTVFAGTFLNTVKGLETVAHIAPSTIGVDTLFNSQGKIPESFLRDTGVPEPMISYLPSLIGSVEPFQFYSCFISYSTKDDEFAQRLHARMRQAGLRVWFAPEDMKGGDYFFEQIERAIQLHDRLLLVLSEDSIQSKWVEREIRKTRKVERAEKRRKLFPITLTDYAMLKKWECLDADSGEDLAEEVRKYHIPDFSNWENHDAFERAFARLEKDLRTSITA
jgi:TIR domain/Pentapeptide repeats (8 copies)